MTDIQEVIQKFEEFNSFLESIDLKEWKEKYSRQEIKEFSRQLYQLKLRSLAYELSKLADEMKIEEFPQLLGVHRYPVIQKIDFLSEEKKIELDQFLGRFRKGDYVSSFWRVVPDSKLTKQIEGFLIEQGVLEERFVALCPNCSDEHISDMMTKQEKEALDALLKEEPTWERYEKLENLLRYGCDECGYETDLERIKPESMYFKTYLKLAMERDNRYDNA